MDINKCKARVTVGALLLHIYPGNVFFLNNFQLGRNMRAAQNNFQFCVKILIDTTQVNAEQGKLGKKLLLLFLTTHIFARCKKKYYQDIFRPRNHRTFAAVRRQRPSFIFIKAFFYIFCRAVSEVIETSIPPIWEVHMLF